MKKVLPFICGLAMAGTVNAQSQHEVEAVMEPSSPLLPAAGVENVNDTLRPVILSGCDQGARTYSGSFGYLTGGNSLGITEVAQLLNLDSSDVEVHSLLVFVTNKEEGPNKSDFSAMVYSSTDTLSPDASLGTSDPVDFDNLDTVNTWTTFSFSSPVSVNSEPFFASVEVENGSDTMSIATSGPNCAGGSSLYLDPDGWGRIGSRFTTSGSPLDPIIYVFAEVDNMSVGLEPNFISKDGLDFYPNPAQDRATIEYDMTGESEVTLLIQDASGRTVFSNTYGVSAESKIDLNLNQFKSGVYTYQVVGSQSQLNGVFMKR